MRPTEESGELFEAFSRINEKAYADPRLLANHVLSKTPHCNDVLARWLRGEKPRQPDTLETAFQIAKYYAINAAAFALHAAAGLMRKASGFSALPRVRELIRKSRAEGRVVTVIDVFMLVRRVDSEGRYKDTYLPGLPETLEARGHAPVVLARLYGSRDPRLLGRVFSIWKDHPTPVLTEVELFTPGDWLRLARHLVSFPFAVLRLTAGLSRDGAEGHVRAALLRCLGQCYLPGESRRLAARRLAALLPEGSKIISWHENQVVDKCFYRGARETRKNVTLYAAQLLTWPPELLNNHPDPSDARHNATPDVTAVNGPYFMPEPLPDAPEYRVGPALRYRDPHTLPTLRPDPSAPILALLSYHPDETARVLRLLAAARPELEKAGLSVVYRFHPAVRPRAFAHLLPRTYTLSGGSLSEALEKASLVVGAGSGALPEAVSRGIPAVAVDSADHTGLNYLPPFGKGTLWERVSAPEELLPARNGLLESMRPEEAVKFRNLLFENPDPERIVRCFDLENANGDNGRRD